MSQPEAILSAEIRIALGSQARHCRLWRNHAGTFFAGRLVREDTKGRTVMLENASRVTGGLTTGAADLIGITSIVITPGMVGQTVAVFTSAEVKVGTAKPRPDQQQWCDMVLAMGGRAGIIRSVDDAVRLVQP